MKKIFASDFDQTLYLHGAEEPIAPGTVPAIRRLQKRGHLFGLCTGRPLVGLAPYLGEIRPDFVIASSGAHITARGLDAPLCQRGISRPVAEAITEEFLGKGSRMMCCIGDELCFFAPVEGFPWAYTLLTSLRDIPEGLVYQISIHCGSLEEARLERQSLLDRFGRDIEVFQNVTDLDVAPAGCSKGKGLLLLSESLAGPGEERRLYGIGDSLNDLPLLEAADVSYTFPCAPPVLQRAATRIVSTLEEALEDALRDD